MSAAWFGRYLETSVYRVEIKNTAGILNNAPNVPTHGRRAGRAGVSRDHRERRGRPVTPPIYHRSARAPRAPSAADLRGGRNPRLLAGAAGAMPGRCRGNALHDALNATWCLSAPQPPRTIAPPTHLPHRQSGCRIAALRAVGDRVLGGGAVRAGGSTRRALKRGGLPRPRPCLAATSPGP